MGKIEEWLNTSLLVLVWFTLCWFIAALFAWGVPTDGEHALVMAIFALYWIAARALQGGENDG